MPEAPPPSLARRHDPLHHDAVAGLEQVQVDGLHCKENGVSGQRKRRAGQTHVRTRRALGRSDATQGKRNKQGREGKE